MAKVGRKHSHYTVRIGDMICQEVALGRTLKDALTKVGFLAPSMPTVWKWMDENDDFRHKMDRARQLQADMMTDRMLELANEVLTKPSAASAYKVASDIMKSLAEVRNPGKYGPKMVHEIKAPMDPMKVQEEIKTLEMELGLKGIVGEKLIKVITTKPATEKQLAAREKFRQYGLAKKAEAAERKANRGK